MIETSASTKIGMHLFKFKVGLQYGDFFNGTKFSFKNEFKFRVQPYFNTSLRIDYDSIELPDHIQAEIFG